MSHSKSTTMRIKILLLNFVIGCTILSCNSNTTQKNPENQSLSLEDSRKKDSDVEFAEFLQDSVDALKIKGYSVKLISGKHKYGGRTKIQYQSLPQLITEANEDSQKKMWTKEKLQSVIDSYRSSCRGGAVTLEIERNTIEGANTENFSIIINLVRNVH